MLEHEICPELGLEYVKSWRDRNGSTLLDLILASHDRACGRVVVTATKMPSEVTLSRLKCSSDLSRADYESSNPWLKDGVLRFVGSHEHHVCIVESPFTPITGKIEAATEDILLLHDGKHHIDMYCVVHQQNASEQYVSEVITDSMAAWGFCGAFLRCKGLESLAGRRELSRDDLAGIARHAKGVFVSVFDAESFLIWDIEGQAAHEM